METRSSQIFEKAEALLAVPLRDCDIFWYQEARALIDQMRNLVGTDIDYCRQALLARIVAPEGEP